MAEDKPNPDQLMDVVPTPVAGVDFSAFRFDPLTDKLLALISRRVTVREMAGETGADPTEVINRLEMLAKGSIVEPLWGRPSMPQAPEAAQQTPEAAQAVAAQPPAAGQPAGAPGARMELEVKTGSITDKGAVDLASDALASSFSGSIGFERGGDKVTFYFERGEAKGVEASAERHDLGEVLKAGKHIDEDIYMRYRSYKDQGSQPVYALRDAGVSERARMARMVVRWGKDLFEEVSGWSNGTYRIVSRAPIPPQVPRCRLKLVEAVVKEDPTAISENWRKKPLNDEQMQYLVERRNLYIVPNEGFQKIGLELSPNREEKRFLDHVLEGSPMQMRKALSISTLRKTTTRSILYLLSTRKAFELHITNPEGESPIPLDELESYYKRLQISDHFRVLNSHAVSIEEEIRERYKRRLELLHSKHYKGATPAQLKLLGKIQERVEEAWKVLGKEKSRQDYRKTIYTQFQLDNFFDMQLEKAEAALTLRGQPREALPLALSAWDLKPGNQKARVVVVAAYNATGRPKEARKFESLGAGPQGDNDE